MYVTLLTGALDRWDTIVDDATLLDDLRDCRCRVARSGSRGRCDVRGGFGGRDRLRQGARLV